MRNLLISREENIFPSKNFRSEIRSILDVKHLINNVSIVSHVEDTQLNVILKRLVLDIAENHLDETIDLEEFDREVYTDDDKQRPKRTIQTYMSDDSFIQLNPTWMGTYCQLSGIKKRHVAIAFLKNATNFGNDLEEVSIIVLVVAPQKDKETKSAFETCRTFASLLCDDELRNTCLQLSDKQKIRETISAAAKNQQEHSDAQQEAEMDEFVEHAKEKSCFYPGKAIYADFMRRLKNYKSDYLDGLNDIRSIRKVISTAIFLVFTILPTSIAYGMLNDENTDGAINVQKVILGQWIGGLVFALFGGQSLLIITTTAPLSIYISVIFKICLENSFDFYAMYFIVGVYAQLFLILYALFQAASLMKFTKRSTEEIFGLFIAFALTYKAIRALVTTYIDNYAACFPEVNSSFVTNGTVNYPSIDCLPESALLFVFMVLGTLFISLSLASLRTSCYLHRTLRDIIADYALPVAVIVMALIARFLFFNVSKSTFNYYGDVSDIHVGAIGGLSGKAHLIALGLSFPLSLLFYVDQILVTKTIDNKQHNLKKGSAYHYDLFVVALINIVLSVLGLPWMHGALPSAFLHLKALSDIEERSHNGYLQAVIVHVRETRLAAILAHILMIPIYFLLIPFISYFIPTALLHGLFLFMAISSLTGNEMWERIMLIFTEQRSYPPSHYIRMIPQRVIHSFTILQLIQLIILIVIGFYPLHYVEMVFPIVIVLFIPIRSLILPLFYRRKYLEIIDGEH